MSPIFVIGFNRPYFFPIIIYYTLGPNILLHWAYLTEKNRVLAISWAATFQIFTIRLEFIECFKVWFGSCERK